MSKKHHRLSRFTYLLLLLSLWNAPSILYLGTGETQTTSYAQTLTAPTIGEASVDIVPSSKISLEQWQALQVASSQNLLADENTIQFFETEFNIDGEYGELKSGALVTDWDALAKNMGASGLALAGAYAVWRRRRSEALKKLRAGDSASLENLFAQAFGSPQSPDAAQISLKTESGLDSKSPTPLSPTTPPHNSTQWEAWGKQHGLLASGATLSVLFLLWQKRQQPPTTANSPWSQYFQSFFKDTAKRSYRDFYKAVYLSSHNQKKLAEAAARTQFESTHPKPIPPAKSQAVTQYETMANYNYWRGFPPYYQAIQQAYAIRYDRQGKTNAIKNGLNKVWQQYYYFQSVGDTRGADAMQRQAQSLINFSNRFATARQRWEITNVQAQAKRNFETLQGPYENYKKDYDAYAPLKAEYEQKLKQAQDDATKPFKGWESSIWQWWQQASVKANSAQQWLSNLNRLRTQNTTALENLKTVATQSFTDSLSLITQVFNQEDLTAIMRGQASSIALPNALPLNPTQAAAKLKTQLEALETEKNAATTIEKYNDQQAQALGYRLVRGSNGRRYYYRPYYNARYARWEERDVALNRDQQAVATKTRESVYAQKAKTIETNIKQQQQRYQAEQLIHLVQNPQASADKSLHQIAQFLRSVHTNSNTTVAHSVWRMIKDLNQWQAELATHRAKIIKPNISWPQKLELEQTIQRLEKNIESHLTQITAYQKAALAAPSLSDNKTTQTARTAFAQSDLKSNKVYQHLQTLHTEREFYKTYGQNIAVLEKLKKDLAKRIESLAYLEGKTAYSHGYAFYDYQALKKDYQNLLNNQLPDVYVQNWSWFNSGYRTKRTTPVPNRNDAQLHDWYHKSVTLFNHESKLAFKEKIKNREAALFAQREAEFERNQLTALKEIFTETEITAYQTLVKTTEAAQAKLSHLNTQETEKKTNFTKQVTQQNTQALTSAPTPKELAIKTLKNSDIKTIALSYESKSNQTQTSQRENMPPQFSEALWQAYRRFNGEWQYAAFAQEAKRLMQQAMSQYKAGLITDSGIPPEPAQTKTVRDYLEDPGRFNRDVEKQIQAVKTGIPRLKQKFAGQAYLATALAQANEKIKALERYQQNGPKAVEQYQQNVAQWQRDNAYVLSQIETGTSNHFKDFEKYLSGFWNQAESLAEAKAKQIEAENIIDTRDTVELVDSSPWKDSSENPALKAELEDFIKNLSDQELGPKSSFLLGNKATNNQSKIYQTYQEKFLRSQGLTWDKFSNDRIQKLHPSIRAKTTEFINRVQDELGLKLRVNKDGHLRDFDTQLKLYCNSRDNGICEGATKFDSTGNWKSDAKPGESYHNYGLAVDFTEINKDGTVNIETDWQKVAAIAKSLGFNNPLPVGDAGHFEMTFGFKHSDLKEKHEAGLFKDGYVDLEKTLEIKETEEEQVEVKSYVFTGKGMSRTEAESIVGYSEDYFQAWLKYQPSVKLEEILREEFVQEHLEDTQTLTLKIFEQFSKDLSGVSSMAEAEIKKVHQDVIKFLKDDHDLEAELANKYIQRVRDADHGNFTKEVAAYFAADAYTNTSDQLFGFERISNKYGIQKEDLTNIESGFSASLYENNDTIIVSFAGTNEIIDWETNIQNALGKITKQYESAAYLANKIENETNKTIVFVGHSLGGGLAALSSAITNKQGVTFNSAGNNPFVMKKSGVELNFIETINAYTDLALPDFIAKKFEKNFPHITNHITRGDLLTTMQEKIPLLPVALGKQVKHDRILNNWVGLALMSKNPKLTLLGIAGGSIYHKKY